jgi:hypothetical protein
MFFPTAVLAASLERPINLPAAEFALKRLRFSSNRTQASRDTSIKALNPFIHSLDN